MTKRSILSLLIGSISLWGQIALAQSSNWINLEPAGGMNIQHLHMRTDGYAAVILAETFPELQSCGGATDPAFGSLLTSSGKLLWLSFIDQANFPNAKNVYAGLLMSHYTGKKLSQIVFTNPATMGAGICYIRSIRSGS